MNDERAENTPAMSASAAPPCLHCGLPVPASRRSTGSHASLFCCFGCKIVYDLARPDRNGDEDSDHTSHALLLRLGAGVFLAMNIMVFSWFFYGNEALGGGVSGSQQTPYAMLAGLLSYLLMLLCTIVVVMLGLPLAMDALSNLNLRRPTRSRVDANLLILVGVCAAYALSVIHTLRGVHDGGHLYFDTAAVILVLVTLGAYLDSSAKRKATRAAEAFLACVPRTAFVRRGGETIEVPADDVQPGDTVRVRPGEGLPVDGLVTEGLSHVNESSLTGESRARGVATGDRVLAGSVNTDGELFITAENVGEGRVVAQMLRLLEKARAQQPRIQRTADRVAAVFIPTVLVLALAVFGYHAWHGAASRGLFDALSVLLISCPCALGLTTPLATWTALSRAARLGVLVHSGRVLERAADVGVVCFDKTGTLTTSQMTLADVTVRGQLSADEVLRIAAGLESASVHPIARAFAAEAHRRNLATPHAANARAIPGLGVEATIEGVTYRLGSDRLLQTSLETTAPTPTLSETPRRAKRPVRHVPLSPSLSADTLDSPAHTTRVHLLRDSQPLAHFDLAEEPRPTAEQAVRDLTSMGVEVIILTGDSAGPAEHLARQLGVRVHHRLLPADKLAFVQSLRAASADRAVAFVGDGINDAPVLAAADVGFAVATGTDLAKQSGNVHLITDDLARIARTLRIARHARNRVRLNLAWAFGYNVIGITLAGAGLLSPIFSASAMIVSSLLIITTSRRAGHLPDEHEAVTLPSPTPLRPVSATAGVTT